MYLSSVILCDNHLLQVCFLIPASLESSLYFKLPKTFHGTLHFTIDTVHGIRRIMQNKQRRLYSPFHNSFSILKSLFSSQRIINL